jgi:hypothetical protein
MVPLVRQGDRGLEVKRVQAALNAHKANPPLVPDGIFGTNTDSALRAFQRANRLDPDGIVGPLTRAALMPFKMLKISGMARCYPSDDPGGSSSSLLVAAKVKTPPILLADNSPTIPAPAPPPPPTAPATPATPSGGGGGWVQQLQPGGQFVWKPWLVRPSLSTPPDPVWSGVLTMAFTYRTKADGTHWEFGPLLQLAINSQSQPGDPLFTFSGGGQVTWADIYAPGDWHILSPFLQGTFFVQGGIQSGGQVTLGNQFSVELVKDRFQIFAQPGIAGTWNFTTGQFTAGPAIAAGAILQW